MTINANNPPSQPALTFDKVHLMRYVVTREMREAPYTIHVEVEAIRYALDGDGVTRIFDPDGSFTAVVKDYDSWVAEQIANAADQAEVDKLTAHATNQEDIIAEMIARLTPIEAVGPSDQT
jgi:hypothetical protein